MKPANRLMTKSTRAITNKICAIPAAVEAIPPKPNTAATRAITRNISAQYNISSPPTCEVNDPAAQTVPDGTVTLATEQPALPTDRSLGVGEIRALEACMRRELTPGEARSGAVSGRVITVLLISFVGACVALGLAWAIFLPH